MKIDRAKLVELLVEKTGMDSEEIDSQLKQLIDRILDAAERGKALEIKEFGMFYFDENGDLKFDPSEELSTEINFKYAGMEPVELKPPRSGSEPDQEISAEKPGTATGEDLDEIFGVDDDGPIEDDAEGPDGGALISPPDKVDRDIDPFSGLLGDASSKMKSSDKPGDEDKIDEDEPEEDPFSFILEDEPEDVDEEEIEEPLFELDDEIEIEPEEEAPFELDEDVDSPETEEEYFDPFRDFDEPEESGEDEYDKDEAVTEPVEEEEPIKEKKPAAKTASYKKSGSVKERDPIMMVISIGLIIILIVAGFFIIPDLFDSSDSEQTPSEPQTEQPAATDQPEDNTADPSTMEEENQAVLTPVEPEESSEVTEEADEPESQSTYGLTGDLVDGANDGYSIVLHSLQSEERAREQAASLISDGYRVLVNPRTVNGETVWRVSVGQFESIQNAQQAAGDLPSPYNSNNFIQRIQN